MIADCVPNSRQLRSISPDKNLEASHNTATCKEDRTSRQIEHWQQQRAEMSCIVDKRANTTKKYEYLQVGRLMVNHKGLQKHVSPEAINKRRHECTVLIGQFNFQTSAKVVSLSVVGNFQRLGYA